MADVHDLHVWTITSGIESLSAHLVLADDMKSGGGDAITAQITTVLKEKFGITHSAIQLEWSSQKAIEAEF